MVGCKGTAKLPLMSNLVCQATLKVADLCSEETTEKIENSEIIPSISAKTRNNFKTSDFVATHSEVYNNTSIEPS